MAKTSRFRLVRYPVAGLAAVAALFLGAPGVIASASAQTLCPSSGTPGGFGESVTYVPGPLDGTCGADSAVTISLPASTDYGKLQFSPSGYTLGNLTGASANVSFTTAGTDAPYYLLAFTDSSDSLGQANAGDQILLIEFQSNALSGNTLALNANSTEFNLYDNTTNTYLQLGQSDTNTLAGWLALFPSLDDETLQGLWIGEGLTGSDTGAESMTINSLNLVPEPASLTLFGAALAGLGFIRRRKTEN